MSHHRRIHFNSKKMVKKISLLSLVPVSPRSSQEVPFKRGYGALPALAQSCMPPRGAPSSRHHQEPCPAAHTCVHSNSILYNCDPWSSPEHFPNKYASAIAIHTSLQAASSFSAGNLRLLNNLALQQECLIFVNRLLSSRYWSHLTSNNINVINCHIT